VHHWLDCTDGGGREDFQRPRKKKRSPEGLQHGLLATKERRERTKVFQPLQTMLRREDSFDCAEATGGFTGKKAFSKQTMYLTPKEKRGDSRPGKKRSKHEKKKTPGQVSS